MSKPKFSKPPMTDEERERKAEAFINLSNEDFSFSNSDVFIAFFDL